MNHLQTIMNAMGSYQAVHKRSRAFLIKIGLPLLLALLSFISISKLYAAVGWVGGMFPAGGSSYTINEGDSFNVFVRVWKGGVTEPPGQGANITCTLRLAEVTAFGGPWGSTSDIAMTYNVDVVNNDEYVGAVAPAAAGLYELSAFCTDTTDNVDMWQSDGNIRLTVNATGGGVTITDARAIWLSQGVMAWNGAGGASYKLLFDPDGGVDAAVAAATACPTAPTAPCSIDLTANGTINGAGFPKNPNAGGLTQLELPGSVSAATVKTLLTGQTAVSAYDGGGALIDATATQIQSVLDDLYVDNGTASAAALGPVYSAGAPTVSLWAPTARSVTLKRYADADTATAVDAAMTLDPASGVWSVAGDASWDRQFYLFDVEVYVPETDAVEHNLVSDPYSVNLSADGSAANDVRSQFVNLDDADLKPSGWDTLSKPALANPEDIVVYEVHVRDFSRDDTTVPASERGAFAAFTETASDGMQHLLALKDAGLTHVHLMPAFDIASVIEKPADRTEPSVPAAARDSQDQQAAVGAARATDSFNWGYDPFHYGAPEGSYSTDPTTTSRILEFREMVKTLNDNDLRVVMDVVYNHTAAYGQADYSVLDQVVPGYYYRYDLAGVQQTTSCCADTASEYAMFDKLMQDTLVRWADEYKVDGFRFDLMNLHTVQNAIDAKNAVQAIDPTIYVYGEGWDFGSAAAKGLDYAKQASMSGTGIGTFNDKIRDAAHGGYSTDSLQIRHQGFINGLSYDWNGYGYAGRDQAALHGAMDTLRSALRGSGNDWNGSGSPYTADPQESVPYVSKHDNETLFDQNVFKLPGATSMADRVRAQNMGLSIVGLSQGVPFFHMGSDILRSKSLDRNSYDSGDWFNRLYWDLSSNNFGEGLPPAWDNDTRWSIMGPLLADTGLDPAAADMQFAAGQLREILRIRGSSPLFRMTTTADINARTAFFNGDNAVDGLIVMGLLDNQAVDLDPNYESILVFFNADKNAHDFVVSGTAGFVLHPIQADGTDADPVVQGAAFNDATDTFSIPARTTAVFVSAEPITFPSDLDWVGNMSPAGAGEPTGIVEGSAAGLTVYGQVYEPGITEGAGQGAGIECSLHWGLYGETWQDQAMSFNVDIDNNDEYMATIDTSTLAPGTYGFTFYCTDDSGVTKKWRDGSDGLLTIIPNDDAIAPSPADEVFVHLFEWKWTDIEKECTFLAEKGYDAIQVSPPMEHVIPVADMGDPAADYPWWVRYQPVTHDATKLISRSGTLAEFQSMVSACNALGVKTYVDAVINHTTGVGSGTGTDGSTFTPYEYPQYTTTDFHMCGTAGNDIANYGDRYEVQNCELANLADLDQSQADVRATLHAYLQDLLDMGVAGFRLDASKHMSAQDINAVLDGLTLSGGGSPYIFQEVIDQGGEPIKSYEYTPNGDVTEFRYSVAAGDIINCNSSPMSSLETLGSGFLESDFAVVFTDNHDNQRGHGAGGACVLDHRDGNDLYDLGNVFMLAYPYGYPKVMSSYYWSNNPASQDGDSKGPPSTTSPFTSGSGPETRPVYTAGQIAGDIPGNCSATYEDGKWVCEHRRTAIANMVEFRAVTAGEPVTDWQNFDGNNHIAFGRNGKGFVALNRTGGTTTQTYQTGMAPGVYCNITEFDYVNGRCLVPGTTTDAAPADLITVDGAGEVVNRALPSLGTIAILNNVQVVDGVQATPTAVGIAGGGSTAITAQVSPPAAGIQVDFVISSGGGTLSAASAVTDANGQATVTYTGAAGPAVARIDATVNGSLLTDPAYLFVVQPVTSSQQEMTDADPDTVGSLAVNSVQIEKQGSGQSWAGVATFAGDPCPAGTPVGIPAASPYVDVLLEETTDITGLAVTVQYTDEADEATHTLYWCNADGNWSEVGGGTIVRDGVNNTVQFTVTDATTPSLAQLEGTPFVAGADISLSVSLGYFLAQADGDQVRFVWQTVTESGIAGFHLLADEADGLRRLNETLIPSAVVDSLEPRRYEFTATTTATRFYLVESTVEGATREYGPYDIGMSYGSYSGNRSIYLPLVQH
ncbi:MAG: pullulanase-type alpha-1,6-glucosidase [Caldilineaceae bacterium]|nr:pullulanase-type alpha-1,6-glucosidase [Caldilineaceae bacterium]